jgi:hypothetical protein
MWYIRTALGRCLLLVRAIQSLNKKVILTSITRRKPSPN